MRLAVSPALPVSTAERPVSGLRLDLAARVSTCTLSGSIVIIKLFSSCLFHKDNTLFFYSAPTSKHFIVFLVTWAGYWCPPGQTVATALPCPPGHFCSQGSAAPELCPSGTYQDREKQATCTVCEAGREPSLLFLPSQKKHTFLFIFKHFYVALCHFSFAESGCKENSSQTTLQVFIC